MAKAGRPVPELAEELEIGKGLIYQWLRQDAAGAKLGGKDEGDAAAGGSTEDVAAELRRLRKQVAELELDNAILKKAAIILGSDPQPPAKRKTT